MYKAITFFHVHNNTDRYARLALISDTDGSEWYVINADNVIKLGDTDPSKGARYLIGSSRPGWFNIATNGTNDKIGNEKYYWKNKGDTVELLLCT